MRRLGLLLIALSLSVLAHAASPALDGTSAAAWKPATGWVSKAPASYGVTNENGALVFSAEGAGTEMPWLINLDNLGISGDERYVLVRYKAKGLSTGPGIYFLHGEEGTRGGLAYALASDLKPDGEWHTLAVDLLAVGPLEVTHNLALKVFVDASGSARLEISKLWFANELPADATMAQAPSQRPVETVQVNWPSAKVAAQTGWTTSPADDYSATLDGKTTTFTVRGHARGMRWLTALPKPLDLGRMPYLSLRYKASGSLAPTTYAIWLGDRESGSGGNSVVALPPTALKADGVWHTVTVKLQKTFTATHLAVGIDSSGDAASLTFDTVTFGSRPPRWSLAEVLDFRYGTDRWPGGQGPHAITGGSASPFLGQRLGLSDWFTQSQVTVQGIPFTVPTDPSQVSQTSTSSFDELSLKAAPGVREIYLLTACAAPAGEPWGVDWQTPRPMEILDVPEKVYYEIRYTSGPPDQVLPLDLASGKWGMRRGLSVNVVHPDPARQVSELVLCDRMQTAGFAIVGVTMLKEKPRVVEPSWQALTYPTPPAKALAGTRPAAQPSAAEPVVAAGVLQASFSPKSGLTWAALGVPSLNNALTCAAGPVFEVRVGGKLLPAADWTLEKMEPTGKGRRFVLHNQAASLGAEVECVPGKGNELLLRMSLTNESTAPTTATLMFPVLRGLCLGSAEDTWYLSGKRGGIINSASASFRDGLGENHPLQMDGFFNPKSGVALACLTHDTVAQHHFRNLAKGSEGGSWSIEYLDRDLAPGKGFAATEAALVLREGDWRAIFAAYDEWLQTWFKPAAPRKPWFEKTFATVSGNAHYDVVADPKVRGNVQRLVDTMNKYIGPCDYVHLFGWGASKQYGDWGDYVHYDEVGGLEYFRGNIQKMQQQGPAVSLYLDGFLSSEKGQVAGAHAKEWAMKRPDGSPQFVPEYQSYDECPYMEGWRKHLADTYARVQKDLSPKIMYIDEIGATDGRWTCWARDHGHNGHEIPYAGEVELLKGIRQAVGPDVVLYTEYPPAEVSRQYTDGSITYQALWSADQEPLAPHFIDLPRFAFPDFKQLHIIYYVGTRAGNWWLLKYPFFNGEVYRIGEPNLPGMDAPSHEFLKRAVLVQCAHREAFASPDVQPLVPTEVSGVFANRFSAAGEHVWTLYNANGRNVRAPVLSVKHAPGATYEDAWNGRKLTPKIVGGRAELAVELGPKGVGCVVQKLR
ncbi:MAG: DUF6259 domain-containing protein [Armatimonadia bacterium]